MYKKIYDFGKKGGKTNKTIKQQAKEIFIGIVFVCLVVFFYSTFPIIIIEYTLAFSNCLNIKIKMYTDNGLSD